VADKKGRNGVTDTIRLRVMKRDGFTCVYCGGHGKDCELEVDHRVPVSKGGNNHISNLFTACRDCNQSKGDAEWKPQQQTTGKSRAKKDPPRNNLGQVIRKTIDGEKLAEPMAETPLDGLHVLIWKDAETYEDKRGEYPNWQGQIWGFIGDEALVKTYSWINGDEYNMEFFPKELFHSGRAKVELFPSSEAMRYAYQTKYGPRPGHYSKAERKAYQDSLTDKQKAAWEAWKAETGSLDYENKTPDQKVSNVEHQWNAAKPPPTGELTDDFD